MIFPWKTWRKCEWLVPEFCHYKLKEWVTFTVSTVQTFYRKLLLFSFFVENACITCWTLPDSIAFNEILNGHLMLWHTAFWKAWFGGFSVYTCQYSRKNRTAFVYCYKEISDKDRTPRHARWDGNITCEEMSQNTVSTIETQWPWHIHTNVWTEIQLFRKLKIRCCSCHKRNITRYNSLK